MHFAYLPPWWLALVIALAVATAVFVAYRRPLSPLSMWQRVALITLRASTLIAIVLLIFRPIVRLPPAGVGDVVVPVLVDISRSMRVADADGQTRIARTAALLRFDLLPALSQQYRTELFTLGEALEPGSVESLAARAGRSDISGALARVRERFRGQRVAGVVVVSDGADTGATGAVQRPGGAGGWPVFAIGVGGTEGLRDREVLGIAAGDQRLDHASVDLQVSAVSSGFGRAPFQLRLLADGKPLESRRVAPAADGSPIEQRFTVFPDSQRPTVYTAEIPADDREPVAENNTRSIMISPAGRKRRLLVLEGAPGFEHTFMTRAWTADVGLEVDSVVRKGRNANGSDTFLVQADAARTAALTSGFPARREDLYAYDALVIANMEGDFFARAQLTMIAEFVAERGGGLLVMGSRSFAQRGLAGTPIEAVLPVELDERRGGLSRASLGYAAPANGLVVTREGETHPIMRLGASGEETRKKWADLPALASTVPLGSARPGAVVLAVASAPGGAVFPVVAVQRYGQGRSMVFGGEASWRWRMMVASTDRSHELFWRQAARWLAEATPDPVAITLPDAAQPGDAVSIDVDARDAAFAPVADATVQATIELPDGEKRPVTFRHASPSAGVSGTSAASARFTSLLHVDRAGLYHVRAEARRGTVVLGVSDRWMYVGGGDREFADPRLNEGFLRRVARDSGGRYVRAADASRIVSWLQEAERQNAAPGQRDLWHEPWVIAVLALLLSAEWVLRRRWGLR
jgi:uncharacterized membrane protein